MENIYKTSDIYLASFAIAKGYKMVSTDKLKQENRNRYKTFFAIAIPKENLQLLKTQFYSGQGENVNVSRYTTALKNLKSVCFSD